MLQVKDTGCGISPQDMPHTFTKFAHPQNATNKLPGGDGLGLALSRRYIWKDLFHMCFPSKKLISNSNMSTFRFWCFLAMKSENIQSMLIFDIFAFSGAFRFVTLMQGNIWLESEGAGKGCTVTFFVKLGLSDKPNANLRRIGHPVQPKQGADTSSIANSNMAIVPLCYQSIV